MGWAPEPLVQMSVSDQIQRACKLSDFPRMPIECSSTLQKDVVRIDKHDGGGTEDAPGHMCALTITLRINLSGAKQHSLIYKGRQRQLFIYFSSKQPPPFAFARQSWIRRRHCKFIAAEQIWCNNIFLEF